MAYAKLDRSKWPPGPWDDEPEDEVYWTSRAGLSCAALRGPRGNWCGYAEVPAASQLAGMHYHLLESCIDVHGGLTYSGTGTINKQGWWVGFDCNHSGDRAPGMAAFSTMDDEFPVRYCILEYVRAECESLARQLADPDLIPRVVRIALGERYEECES